MPEEGNPLEVVVLVFSMTVLVTLMVVVVKRDERRLARRNDEAALERAWPPQSRDSALIGLSLLGTPLLGLFAVCFHFCRTRRWRPKGILLGLGFTLLILFVNVVSVTALAWALGMPLDDEPEPNDKGRPPAASPAPRRR